MTIADTDVLIDFLTGTQPGASQVAAELERGSLSTTVISRFELLSGARNARQGAEIRELLAALANLPLEEDAANRAAEVRLSLARSGTPIGMADSLIAGIALLRDATLLTRNRKHFERVAGLRLAT